MVKRSNFLLGVILILFMTGSVFAATNMQSHPINQIDGFNLSGINITLNSSYNLNIRGNLTASTGLFSWLGSLLNRITELFVQDINFNGTINGSGNIITTGNISIDHINATDWTNVTITEIQISDLQSYILTANEGNLNVNSSDFWDNFNVPDDIVYSDLYTNFWDADVDLGNYNLTNLNWLEATTLNITGTSYLGDLVITADNITVNNIISKDGNISFWNSTKSEIVRFTDEGRVGIGTASPGALLDIDISGGGTATALNIDSDSTNTLVDIDASALSADDYAVDINVNSGARGLYVYSPDEWAIYGVSGSNFGVYGQSTSSYGVYGRSTSGYGIYGLIYDTATNDVSYVQKLSHTTSETAAAGFGTGIEFELEDDGGGVDVLAAIQVLSTAATAGAEHGAFAFLTADIGDDGLAERMRIDEDGNVGIGTTNPSHKLNVNGSANITGTLYYGTLDGEADFNVNSSNFLDTYDSSYFMPINTSVTGNFDFNGGWIGGGFSIIGGDIYAQTGYFYNISSLSVNYLNINGSLLPTIGFDNTFDIGNASLRWRDLWLSRNANITGNVTASYFIGDGSQLTGLVLTETDPLWSGNQSLVYLNTNPFSFYNSTSIPSYILTANEGNLNVNSSNYWDNYNTPSDFLWTAGFNTTGDTRWLTSYSETDPLWSANQSSYWDTGTDLDTVISTDEITELKIDFNTACAAGNHLYVSGNNLACEADDDTTYSSSDFTHDDLIAGTIADHDTGATGTELDTLTDNSMGDALHRHSELSASDGTPDRALVVDAAGLVGIGTASPNSPLHIAGLYTDIAPDNAGIQAGVYGSGHPVLKIVGDGDGGIIDFTESPNTEWDMRIRLFDTDKLAITGGNLGIGTANPGEVLEVAGNINSTGGDICITGGNCLSEVGGIPSGMISMFDGSCPAGWNIADGTSGTPDLINKFIRAETTAGNTGGSDDAIVVTHNHGNTGIQSTNHNHALASHGHRSVQGYLGGSQYYAQTAGASAGWSTSNIEGSGVLTTGSQFSSVNHAHAVNNAGSSGTDKNMPLYYSLVFCVKT